MKIFYVIPFIVLIIYISFNKTTIKDIKHFSFSYTSGYMMNSDTRYQIEYEEGKYIAYIKPYGKSEEETIKKEVNKDQIEKLEDILNKYKVSKWNGFHKNNKNVLDGDSFSMYITFNKSEIEASGYMKYPSNYKEVKEEIDSLFEEIIK